MDGHTQGRGEYIWINIHMKVYTGGEGDIYGQTYKMEYIQERGTHIEGHTHGQTYKRGREIVKKGSSGYMQSMVRS